MDLPELQRSVDQWIVQNGGYWNEFQILARLTEELGEVAGALERQAGLRPRRAEVDLELEVGDVLFTLAAFANRNNIDLDQALRRVLAKYDLRDSADWQKKQTAHED